MIVYTSISRYEDATVLCESTTSGMEGNFALVSTQLLQAFRSSNALPDGARRTFVHRSSSNLELGGMPIPFCTSGMVWGLDSWFSCDTSDPSIVPLDAYFHILKEDGVVYLGLTNDAGRPSRYVRSYYLVILFFFVNFPS